MRQKHLLSVTTARSDTMRSKVWPFSCVRILSVTRMAKKRLIRPRDLSQRATLVEDAKPKLGMPGPYKKHQEAASHLP